MDNRASATYKEKIGIKKRGDMVNGLEKKKKTTCNSEGQ